MNINWVSVEDELPPVDGMYEITNHPEFSEDPIRRECTGTAYYDGWGFEYLGVYRSPGYWRKITPKLKKRYGKKNDK